MELVTAQAHSAPTHFVVCYRCSYQSHETGSSCPQCSFPLITERELSPPGGMRLSNVLHRDSISIGAPPLPGVDAAPRQAQLLAESRKRRRQASRPASPGPLAPQHAAPLAPVAEASSWQVALVCCSAVTVGVLAAAIQSLL